MVLVVRININFLTVFRIDILHDKKKKMCEARLDQISQ